MLTESHILELQAELLGIYATIEGMKALNTYQEARGETVAFNLESFMQEAYKAKVVQDTVIQLTGG